MGLLGGNKIIGNAALRERLYSEVKDNSLSHAYIIEGRSGSGKHLFAKSIIASLACEGKGETLPCGECKNCRDIFDCKCPDVMIIGREDKASIGIEAIRSVKASLPTVPNNLEIKAYIIEDADTMTTQAQNAFLLSLEQPPSFVFFFLLCENSRSLLETIRSRAPILRTEPIPSEEIKDYICSERAEKSLRDAALMLKRSQPEEFDTIIISAEGSIGRALELLSPKTRKPISERRAFALEFINKLRVSGRGEHIMSMLLRFPGKRDELALQLEYIKTALRDLILLKKSEGVPLCFFADREEALELSGAFFEKKLISVFQEVDEARDAILKNANVRLTLISLLSKL